MAPGNGMYKEKVFLGASGAGTRWFYTTWKNVDFFRFLGKKSNFLLDNYTLKWYNQSNKREGKPEIQNPREEQKIWL